MSRSKHAPPATPTKSAIERQREFFEHDLLELRVLWPRLLAAVGRDSAGLSSSGGGGPTGGVKGSPAPMNVDVFQAIAEIEGGCQSVVAEFRRLLGATSPSAWPRRKYLTRPEGSGPVCESCRHQSCLRIGGLWILWPKFTVAVILERLPIWHADLVRAGQPLAAYMCDDVAKWRRSARTALRLSRRGQVLDWLCPDHRDTEPTCLRRDRDEAELHKAILNGQRTPRGEQPITWIVAESVHCPQCGRRWNGAAELAELAREIQAIEGGR